MARAPKLVKTMPPLPRPPKALPPEKAVMAPPRIKPASTRNYGKGGTPLSGSPDQGIRGAGIAGSFGGPFDGV